MECFPLTLVGGFPDACHFPDDLMSPTTNSAVAMGPDFFWHRWGGDDPTILYNITR